VEVAEGEEDGLELGFFGAHLNCALVEVVEGFMEVGLHALSLEKICESLV